MMRVRAIRLAEVGRFRAPVALEGLSGKLDVLAGPNELGKSTIFAALHAALFQKFSAGGRDIQRLVPYQGGAPIVEVEFEAGATHWRLRKQFVSGKKAELIDLGSGRVLRNADADGALAELLRGPEHLERFGLLWVGQDTAVDKLISVQPGVGLPSLVETEVAALSVDAVARAIHERVRTELSALQTAKTGKPTGVWSTQIKDRDRLAAEFADAETRLAAQSERLARLADRLAARDLLVAPDVLARRAQAIRDAEAARVEADATARQRMEAEQALAVAQSSLAAADAEHSALAGRIAELARLMSDQAANSKALSDLAARTAESHIRQKSAEAEVQRQQNDVASLESRRQQVEAALRARTAAAEQAALDEQIARARSLIAARSAADVAIRDLQRYSSVKIDGLKTQEAQLARLDAQFAAAAPEVRITLALDGTGRILRDGEPMLTSQTVHPEQPLTLSIPGIGDIRISPNGASATDEKRQQRERLRGEIEQGLADLHVSTLTDAEQRLRERVQAEQALRDATVRFEAVAPQGLESLVARRAALAAIVAEGTGTDCPASIAEVETELVAQRRKLDLARNALGLVNKDLDIFGERATALEAGRAKVARDLAALKSGFGDNSVSDEALASVARRLDEARVRFTEAKRQRDAWGAGGRDIAALDAALDRAQTAEADAQRRVMDVEREITELAAGLAALRDDDIEAAHQSLKDELEGSALRLSRIETRVAALRRLDAEFTAAAEAQRSQISAPVLSRIAPYLAHVFGSADLTLDETFSPEALTRGGSREALVNLSHGTREQIAILARLGLAKLLSERNAAVPVVLDDALVYADDRRIGAMFSALAQASAFHQVIVLTCREATFAGLSETVEANLLRLQPWQV